MNLSLLRPALFLGAFLVLDLGELGLQTVALFDRAPVPSAIRARLLLDEAQAFAHLLGRVGRLLLLGDSRASLQDLACLGIDGLRRLLHRR